MDGTKNVFQAIRKSKKEFDKELSDQKKDEDPFAVDWSNNQIDVAQGNWD